MCHRSSVILVPTARGEGLYEPPPEARTGPGVSCYFLSPRPCPYRGSEEGEGAPSPAPTAIASPSMEETRGECIPQMTYSYCFMTIT